MSGRRWTTQATDVAKAMAGRIINHFRFNAILAYSPGVRWRNSTLIEHSLSDKLQFVVDVRERHVPFKLSYSTLDRQTKVYRTTASTTTGALRRLRQTEFSLPGAAPVQLHAWPLFYRL